MGDTVKFENKDGIAILTMNQPKKLNALDDGELDDLEACIDKIAVDPTVDVVIITGEGKAFVAGADISQMQDYGPARAAEYARKGQGIFMKIQHLPQPVIAAINGFAFGGGNELTMSCDIRIASEKAKIGQPEVGLGITAGFGGTQRLPRHIGAAKASYMLFTGAPIDAATALAYGLVSEVVAPEKLLDRAIEIAQLIKKADKCAVQQTKKAIQRGLEAPMSTGMEFEAQAFAVCFSEPGQKTRMHAFTSKSKK